MTYSIVAREPESGALGIAVASRFFAVGAIVPHIASGVGAIASQAFPNPYVGCEGLVLMRAGTAPSDIVSTFLAHDAGYPHRQFHMIDAAGRMAAHTGEKCVDWAGHVQGEDVSVAGNMLAGPQVIAETLRAYQAAAGAEFAGRLLTAMQAGEDAGGDKRGKQSACLVIFRGEEYPWLDIRADDHGDPLSELRRLYAVAQERYLTFAEAMPTRESPNGMLDRSSIDARIAEMERQRADRGEPTASLMQNKPGY